jgi:hypothetical protein
VLRSLTDQLRIVVTPEQIGAVRLRFGRPLGEVATVNVENGSWDAALRALNGLQKDTLPKGARCMVLLSDHFMRYQVLPWQPALTTRGEWDAFARQSFKIAFGAISDKWRISLSMHRYGTPLVAASVEEDFVQGVEAVVQSMGLKLQGIEPHFMSVFNRYRNRCKKADFWLVIHEAGGRLCMAKVNNRQWTNVSSRQLSEEDARDPGVCLLREISRHPGDLANKLFYLHASREMVRSIGATLGNAVKTVALAEGDFPGAGGEIRRLALC